MKLKNHGGRHTSTYHKSIQDRLNYAYQGVAGKGELAAKGALDDVLDNIEREIGTGVLKPYATKNVYMP